ncbi:MAG: hypothetical protein HRK26_05030 [Rickettsiaceae bacterium H1]|nr:hypothetical protein [Rickettsiaceae bacterium H1]
MWCGIFKIRFKLCAQKLLKLFDRENIPVFSGFNAPMIYSNIFPGHIRNAASCGYNEPNLNSTTISVTSSPVISGLAKILADAKNKIQILLLGGGNTLGKYIESDPI